MTSVTRAVGVFTLALGACVLVMMGGSIPTLKAAPPPSPPTPVSAVQVVNTTADAVPTVAQGVTAIAGTVTLTSGATVAVSNSAATPLFVQVPTPPRRAFQSTLQIGIPAGGRAGSTSIVVPSGGARLVIEEISVAATDSSTTLIGKLQTSVDGQLAEHFLPPFPGVATSTGRPLTTVQARHVYADPGTTITASFETPAGYASVSLSTQFWVTISGFVE
jgi:hypothetical protein